MSEVVKGDWHLLDERDFLVRSLEDAAAEHAAGDLGDEDYALLRARDERRLADVEATLAAASPVPVPARTTPDEDADTAGDGADTRHADGGEAGDPAAAAAAADGAGAVTVPARTYRRRFRFVRWRRRWWLAAGGAVLLVAAAVVLVVQLTAPRLPGEDATGGVELNTAQQVERQLTQAETLVSHGKGDEALQIYGEVLTEDPRDPTALAEWGWLDWQAAEKAKEATVAAEGASALEQAVKVDPKMFAAQYYLGDILVQEGDPAKAVTHFSAFLADHPTSAWLDDAASEIRTAYADAGRSVPSGVPKS